MGDERQHDNAQVPEPDGPAQAPMLGVDAEALAVGGRSGADQRRLLLALQRSAGNAAAARLLRAVAPPRVARAPGAGGASLLVVDGPTGGQMTVAEFLDGVKTAACATAEEAFAGTEFNAQGCPWIEHWIDHYRLRSPAEVEVAVRRYAPAAAGAATAAEWIPLICERIRVGIEAWRTTGEIPTPPADGPGAPPGEPPAATAAAVARQAKDDPHAVQTRLGPGRPLDPTVNTRMGGAFGADFSGVRVHDDARGAELSSALNSHAFTVGRHVAFAAGRYEPGTVVGDALIAHELAHVLQQDGASVGVAREAESDADTAAATTIGALYLDPRLGGRVRPVARSPLAIQSCPSGTPITDKYGIVDLNQPSRVLTGSTSEFGLHIRSQQRAGGEWPWADWTIETPSKKIKKLSPDTTVKYKWDEVGTHYVEARYLPTGSQQFEIHPKTVVVEDYEGAVGEAFGATKPIAPHAYERFRAGLEMQAIQAGGGVVVDQGSPDNDSISLDYGDNPVRFEPPHKWTHTYRVKRVVPAGDNAPADFRWYAIPQRGYPSLHAKRTTFMGKEAFDLGNKSWASLQLIQPDDIEIVCEVIGEDGKLLRVLRYRQVVMTNEQAAAVDRVREAMKTASDQIAAIQPGAEQALRASHTSLQTGRSTELALFAGPAKTGTGTVLVDVTPGVRRSQYSGANLEAAVADFDKNNEWPPGAIVLEGPGLGRRRLKPRGESEDKALSSDLGWASLGFAALGVISLFTPAAVAAPYLFAAAAATGAASGGLSIADQLRNNEPDAISIAVDVAGIAASMFGLGEASAAIAAGRQGGQQGGGAVVRALTARGEKMALSGGTQFLRYAGFTSDVVQGVLISYKTAQDIDKVLENSKLSRDEKVSQIVRMLAMVAMQGGLLAYGARDLRRARSRIDKALGDPALSKSLKADQLDHLGALDDTALRHLNGLNEAELDSVARVAGTNKGGARELSKTHGKDFVDVARTGRFNTVEEVAEELGRRKGAAAQTTPHAPGEPVGEARLPEKAVRTEHGEIGPTGRPADSLAMEYKMAANAHGEPHEFHLTEDGRLWRCSDACTEIVANIEDRIRIVRERSITTQRGIEWTQKWRAEAMEISKRARWVRDRVKQLADDHAKKVRNIGKAKAPGRAEKLEGARQEWLKEEHRIVREHAESLEMRMSELERKLGGYGRPVGAGIPGVPPGPPPSVDGLRTRYTDIMNAERGLADEAASIEKAATNPANKLDVERRLVDLQRRLAEAANDRIPDMIAQARLLQSRAGTGLVKVGSDTHAAAFVGNIRTVSGAHDPVTRQRTRAVIERGQQIGHTFAPDNYDGSMAKALNAEFKDTAQHVAAAGTVRASHAEKQASRALPGQPIGVSLPMCYDCFDYFRREAVAGGRPLVVADPDMVRVFHPDGRVTSPHYSAPPKADGPNQP
jgi:uncharacterized protein DUF4157